MNDVIDACTEYTERHVCRSNCHAKLFAVESNSLCMESLVCICVVCKILQLIGLHMCVCVCVCVCACVRACVPVWFHVEAIVRAAVRSAFLTICLIVLE
jgi:hypothetical protein